MAAEVAFGVLHELDLVLVTDAVEGDRPVDLADERMAGLDAAVEDADAHALAGRAAPGPLARDALRPVDPDRDLVSGAGREAPGRKALGLLGCGLLLGHPRIVRLWPSTS